MQPSPVSSQKLFQPIQLGTLPLKNRMVMAPMTRARAGASRVPNVLMEMYYAMRATAGLIITEATTISPDALGWIDNPGIYTPEMITGWQKVTEAVHQNGGHIFMQLWHCGRASHSSFFENGQLPSAPSALAIPGTIHAPVGKVPHEIPHALTSDEILVIVENYRVAAENAKQAGFDGIEIHAANGYLLDEFLRNGANQRTDDYGGSFENRSRFLLNVLDAVITVWPADRVGVRFSPGGSYNGMSDSNPQALFQYVLQALNAHDLAYVHLCNPDEPDKVEAGLRVEDFRPYYQGTLIGCLGYDQASGEALLQSGGADLVAYGRPFIANPDLVERFQHSWPLNEVDYTTLYSSGDRGYLDYMTYSGALLPA
jgi:N-ethylmaleimide reductase